jgi:hypothetical protein
MTETTMGPTEMEPETPATEMPEESVAPTESETIGVTAATTDMEPAMAAEVTAAPSEAETMGETIGETMGETTATTETGSIMAAVETPAPSVEETMGESMGETMGDTMGDTTASTGMLRLLAPPETPAPSEEETMGESMGETMGETMAETMVEEPAMAAEAMDDDEPGILELAGQNGDGAFPLGACQGDCDNDREVSSCGWTLFVAYFIQSLILGFPNT